MMKVQLDGLPDWLGWLQPGTALRIDVGLEGDWSGTVRTLWTPGHRGRDLHPPLLAHPQFRPCVEIYLRDGWWGIHCFRHHNGHYVFDAEKAIAIIRFVEGLDPGA